MFTELSPFFNVSVEVARALELGLPVVALESTVITHGLPYPENLTLAENMESTIRSQGALPATVGVLDGQVRVGLLSAELQRLAGKENILKISTRDFAAALVKQQSGGTTVAGTMFAAKTTGIRVFATGGIGGVHHDLSPRRRKPFDISADLTALAGIPMVVVCAGAKAILDLPATLEVLETYGVPVIGYQSDDFPAFYTRSSGLKTSARAETPEEVALIAHTHWKLGMKSAILLTVPPPEDVALPGKTVGDAVRHALREAEEKKIIGQMVTPFLLNAVAQATKGASVRANIGLLLNNAQVAGQIARAMSSAYKLA